MNEVEELVAALRVLRGGKGFATYDDALMGRIRALYRVLGSPPDTDEAYLIRALAELADVRRSSLAKANQTNRRRTNVLADKARELTGQGFSDDYVRRKVGRHIDTVRRWRREGR